MSALAARRAGRRTRSRGLAPGGGREASRVRDGQAGPGAEPTLFDAAALAPGTSRPVPPSPAENGRGEMAGPRRRELGGSGPAAGEPTLDALLTGVWRELTAARSVACPLCGGVLAPRASAHAHGAGGRCASCDTTID